MADPAFFGIWRNFKARPKLFMERMYVREASSSAGSTSIVIGAAAGLMVSMDNLMLLSMSMNVQ
jgi:hypothetical protein